MKKYSFAIVLTVSNFFLFSPFSYAQYDNNQIASIIKVWGFLNYNSSYILTSEINWDQELIIALENYDSTKSSEVSCMYLLSKLPPIQKRKNIKDSQEASSRFSWIEKDSLIPRPVKEYLNDLVNVKKPFPNRYIYPKYSDVIGHINPNKLDFDYSNKYHRLLNLARYWTIMKYFNPYLDLLSPWDETLTEMISVFSDSRSEVDFYRALLRLNAKINDSHSFINVFPLSFGKEVFGKYYLQDLNLSAIGGKIFVSQIHQDSKTAVRPGDILVEIDGIKLGNYLDSAVNLASLSFSDTTKMLALLVRSNQITTKWTFIRGSDTIPTILHFRDTPQSFSSENINCLTDSFNNFYYFKPNNCTLKEFKDNIKIARRHDGVILDMRCYPKDLHKVIKSTFSARRKHFATLHYVDTSHPGSFCSKKVKTPLLGKRYKKKVVVLVSDRTVSASEYTVMAIQTNPFATVIGTHTGGTNGDVVSIPLHGGYGCSFTSLGVYYPDGFVNHHNGIKLDHKVVESIEDYLKVDKILEIGKLEFK